jgi:hypothetical protein
MIRKVIAGSLLQDIGGLVPGCESSHPQRGVEILDGWGIESEAVKQIILQHHERSDGSGYPLGLRGDQIFHLARIVTLSNDFTEHLLRCDLPPRQALEMFPLERYDSEACTGLTELLLGGSDE